MKSPSLDFLPIVHKFPNRFPVYLPGLSLGIYIQFIIDLESSTPHISLAPYRMTLDELKDLNSHFQDLQGKVLIRLSLSSWSYPILLIRKKDGSICIRTNYMQLNKVMIKNRSPMPHTDDLFDYFQGAIVFSKFKLRFGTTN